MTPKKMDRWERIARERMEKDGGLRSDSAADLLRKEHAAVVRMVKNALNESIARDLPETGPGYQCACRHILAHLERRAQ